VFCISCGNQNPDVAKFCAVCGTPVDGSQSSNRQPGAALGTSQPSEPAVERCKTVVKLTKRGSVMASKSKIVAEGWGPGGPYIVDGAAPDIYYTPDRSAPGQARYADQWSKAVQALFGRLSAAGWVQEREAASGKWWEQVFVRPVSNPNL
jgi:zinc-ribbon domain